MKLLIIILFISNVALCQHLHYDMVSVSHINDTTHMQVLDSLYASNGYFSLSDSLIIQHNNKSDITYIVSQKFLDLDCKCYCYLTINSKNAYAIVYNDFDYTLLIGKISVPKETLYLKMYYFKFENQEKK